MFPVHQQRLENLSLVPVSGNRSCEVVLASWSFDRCFALQRELAEPRLVDSSVSFVPSRSGEAVPGPNRRLAGSRSCGVAR